MNDTNRTPIAYVISERGVYTHRIRVAPDWDAAVAVAVDMAQTETGLNGKPDGHHFYVISAHYPGGDIAPRATVRAEEASGFGLSGRIIMLGFGDDTSTHVGDLK